MTCGKFRAGIVEWARGEEPSRALRIHAAGCDDCWRFLEEQQALTAALRNVAAAGIPAGNAAAVMRRAGRQQKARVAGWVAVAAVLAAAAVLMVTPNPAKPPAVSEGFLPIPYTVPLSPEEEATVVRMEVPVTALMAAGFEVPGAVPGASVQADVLVSQDGRARAIRPLPFSNSD